MYYISNNNFLLLYTKETSHRIDDDSIFLKNNSRRIGDDNYFIYNYKLTFYVSFFIIKI